MHTRTSTTTAAALVAMVLAAGGCVADESEPEPGAVATAPLVSVPPGEAPDVSPSPSDDDAPGDDETGAPDDGPAFVDASAVATSDPGAGASLTVTDVRAATHDGFDRVVLDLGGTGTPGWRVEYVDQALDDGSGKPVDVAGGAVLQVRVSGTGIPADTGVEEYGGAPVDLTGEAVRQVVYRFVFEGYTTAFVGVDERRPFRVLALTDPARLVIDVQH